MNYTRELCKAIEDYKEARSQIQELVCSKESQNSLF